VSQPTPELPPHLPVLDLMMSTVLARALYAVTERGVPDLLADGPRTPEELAAKVGVQPVPLLQVMRALAAQGLFTQGDDGRFGLTPAGETLVSGHPTAARDLVVTFGGPAMWQALGAMKETVETGRTGFDLALGMPFFDYLRRHPDLETTFNRTMIAVHGGEPAAVAEAYDFTGINRIVDVGGGLGTLLLTVLSRHPHLNGVLYDAPSVVEQATAAIAAAGLGDRCTGEGGDFFASVPAGGDAYILSHIIHDWDEAACQTILRHCRSAMAPGGRVLIVEMVLPPGAEPHPGKTLDVIMLAVPGGRERTADEYGELLAGAGLRLERVVPTASPVSIVEAVPDGA
jgi:hypothetical protein